jgi:FkbM family methyltransferase
MNRNALRKRVRAARLGFLMGRSSGFEPPTTVRLRGTRSELLIPRDDHGVQFVFYDVLLTDCYRLDRNRGRYRTILDVGGNVGIFALAARMANPNAVIHSYEPNKGLERFLSQQCATAGSQYFLEAIGPAQTTARMEMTGDTSVAGATVVDKAGEVQVTPLAVAVSRLGGSVDFAKLDCEGSEWSLFSVPDQWADIRSVAVEYHTDSRHRGDDAVDALRELGYSVSGHVADERTGVLFARR